MRGFPDFARRVEVHGSDDQANDDVRPDRGIAGGDKSRRDDADVGERIVAGGKEGGTGQRAFRLAVAGKKQDDKIKAIRKLLDGAKGSIEREATRALLARAKLPLAPPSTLTPEDFLRLMAVDKKSDNGQLRLILLRKPGQGVITGAADARRLRETLEHALLPR